jgi:hypothetical protein
VAKVGKMDGSKLDTAKYLSTGSFLMNVIFGTLAKNI